MLSPQTVRWVSVSLFLGLVVLLFVQWISSPIQRDDSRQAEKINLALRRTAHHLLRIAGDSTSRIPAVQQSDPRTFHLQLNHAFNYDTLPKLLSQSLAVHRIKGNYDVAVLDCATRELQLGYTLADLLSKEPIACGGRSMPAGCYILQLTFDTPAPVSQPRPYWPVLALGGLLTGFLVLVWRQKTGPPSRPETAVEPTIQPQPETVPDSTTRLCFGQSCLDVSNQTLVIDGQVQNLTYREAKLLRVLVSHANQVLERDQIMKLVWEDEGIIVSRSLDVFVSRLRKLVQHDALVKIVAVHGVGYRMEVQPG